MARGTPTPIYTLACELSELLQDSLTAALADSQVTPAEGRQVTLLAQAVVTVTAELEERYLETQHAFKYGKERGCREPANAALLAGLVGAA